VSVWNELPEAVVEAGTIYPFSSNERGHIVEEDSVKQSGKLEEIIIRKEDVLGILKNLRIDKSPGLDVISPRILWEVRDEIAEPLAKIFSSSMSTGVLPEDWKEANVVPLFKSGN